MSSNYSPVSGITPGAQSEFRNQGGQAARPRDAATLIVVRELKGKPSILMGKRSANHKFMPNKYVFPGGRVDPCDSRLTLPTDLRAPVQRRLAKHVARRVTQGRLRATALAAIRETFEETGLVIGAPAKQKLTSANSDWQNYFSHGVRPPLEALDFIARAITPPQRVRRFDTRFFMVSDQYLASDPEDMSRASGELTGLHWLTPAEAYDLDLPLITKQVLKIVEARLAFDPAKRHTKPATFVRFKGNKPLISDL